MWTPDGRHIIFVDASNRNLYRKAADGTGNDERLTTSTQLQRPNAISPDGTRLVIEEQMPAAGFDFMLLPLDGTPAREPLLQTPFDERNAAISPDGRWMAYESNESGQSANLCTAVSERRRCDATRSRLAADERRCGRQTGMTCIS